MTTSSTKEDDTTMPSHHHDRPVATLDEAGPPPSKRVRYDDGATTSSAINTLAAMAMMAMSSNGSDLDSASSAATTNSLLHPHSSSSEQAVVSATSSSSSDSDDEESSDSSDTNEDDVRNPPLSNHNSTNVDSDSDSDGYIEDRRRVRFAPPAVSSADDAAGDADADHNHASAAVLTLIGPDAQHPRPTKQDGFWWTRLDRCSFLEDSHVLLDEFREFRDDQLRNFQRVQDRCMNSCHSGSGTAIARGTSRLSVEDESAYLPALILPASVRGLEWGLQRRPEDDDDEQAGRRHHQISSSQRRRDHRRRILELQEEILFEQEDGDDFDDDSSTGVIKRNLSALLRQQSEKSSRGHCVLARLLAKGDEIQAKGGRTASDRVSSSPLSPTTSSPSSGLNHRYHHLATTSGIAIRPKPQQLFRSRCSIMGGRPY